MTTLKYQKWDKNTFFKTEKEVVNCQKIRQSFELGRYLSNFVRNLGEIKNIPPKFANQKTANGYYTKP